MEEIDVPSYFLCPISLQMMRDPVTVSSGITYNRDSIAEWFFTSKKNTCPVTKQVISEFDLIPNHTLRRLIQSWCTLNASRGIERIPTPRPATNKAQIAKILNDAKSPQQQIKCLRKLRSIANENSTSKRCMEAAGAVEFLASLVGKFSSLSFEESADHDGFEIARPSDEALSILHSLQISDSGLKNLAMKNKGEFIHSLTRVMQRDSYKSLAYALLLLKSVLEVADPMTLITLRTELFVEIVQVLHDQISRQVSKAALQLLINICPWGRNRIKAIEGGVVWVLIDLLIDSTEKRICDMVLHILDLLTQCAEGRAELLRHAAGLAVVSKKILRVSQVANEKAVRILLSISKFSATPFVLQEMLQTGVVSKLCLHNGVWKNSSCVPVNLLSSYSS